MTKEFCKPWNAGQASNPKAVGRRLGRLLDALSDEINPNIADGAIVRLIHEFRWSLIQNLEMDGWTITVPGNRTRVTRSKGVSDAR